MKLFKSAQKTKLLENCLKGVAITAFLLLVIPFAFGQSGRRIPDRPIPTKEELPKPEPTPVPQTEKEVKPEFSIVYVYNIPLSMDMSFPYPEKMNSWIQERLRTSKLLEVRSGGDAQYKKASEMAKESAESYVLYAQLEEDQFVDLNRNKTRASQGAVWINFVLFAPKTGNVKQRGRASLKPELLNSRIGNPNNKRSCFPSMTNDDYLLAEASYEVAERTMNALSLPILPIKCGLLF